MPYYGRENYFANNLYTLDTIENSPAQKNITFLEIWSINLIVFRLLKIVDFVPEAEMRENC